MQSASSNIRKPDRPVQNSLTDVLIIADLSSPTVTFTRSALLLLSTLQSDSKKEKNRIIQDIF